MKIKILKRELTDGSHVYDVMIGTTLFTAYSKIDAEKFADAVLASIERHTLQSPVIAYNY